MGDYYRACYRPVDKRKTRHVEAIREKRILTLKRTCSAFSRFLSRNFAGLEIVG
jgi:hypothetical protein